MAIIITGGGVSQISGSVGGNTFSRNRSGAYVRNRSIPVNPNSSRQQTARANMSAAVIAWGQTLTEAQREAWRLYAASVPVKNRLGQNIYLTGQNMYVRTFTARALAGITAIAAAPTTFDLGTPDNELSVALTATGNIISVTFDEDLDWVDEDDSAMLIYIGQPQNASRKFFNGPWRYAGKIEGDSVTAPVAPVGVVGTFTMSEDQAVWIGIRIAHADGRLTTMQIVGPSSVGS